MKRVLIIGIDSFTGEHLSKTLGKKGWDVYGTSYSTAGDKLYKCDINNVAQVARALREVKPDSIVHLAGISFPAHAYVQDFYKVNTVAAINILDEILQLEYKPKKIILVSSSIVYGNQGVEVLDEDLCPNPSGHYAASKLAMESLAKNYFDKLPIVIARPFNYTGLGQADHFLIPKIVKAFKDRKQTIELGNLDVSREFNAVDFVSDIYSRLLTSAKAEGVVNIASGRGIALLDVIAMMNEIAGYEIQIKVNPAYVRKGEIKSLTGSKEKLVHFIGDIKQKTFKETLQEMYEG